MRSDSVQVHSEAEREEQPVVIRNRDIPLLADILSIMQEICQIEKRREWQRERMEHITQHLSGMPRGGGNPKGFDDAFALLSDLDAQHETRCRAYVMEMKAAQKIINGIESRSMRAFVVMKYMTNAPDSEIMRQLGMTRTGFNRARRAVESAPHMAAVKWRDRYMLAGD